VGALRTHRNEGLGGTVGVDDGRRTRGRRGPVRLARVPFAVLTVAFRIAARRRVDTKFETGSLGFAGLEIKEMGAPSALYVVELRRADAPTKLVAFRRRLIRDGHGLLWIEGGHRLGDEPPHPPRLAPRQRFFFEDRANRRLRGHCLVARFVL